MKKLFIATTPNDIKISNREVICGKEAISTYLSENEKGVLSAINSVREIELKQAINVILNSNKEANFNVILYDNEEETLLISSDRTTDLSGYNRFLNQNYYEENNKNYLEKIANEITFIETDKNFEKNNYINLLELSSIVENIVTKNNELHILEGEIKDGFQNCVREFLTSDFRIEFGTLEKHGSENQLTLSFIENVEEHDKIRLKYIITKIAEDDFRIDKDYSYSESEKSFVKPEFISEIDAKIYAFVFVNYGQYILENYEELLLRVESNAKEISIPISNYDSEVTFYTTATTWNNKKSKLYDGYAIKNEPENYFYKNDSDLKDAELHFLSNTYIAISSCPNFLQTEIFKHYKQQEKLKTKQKRLSLREKFTELLKK